MSWGVVVPVKTLVHAKSRLVGHPQPRRGRLALAFARDTVAAAQRAPEVAEVVVVTDDHEVATAIEGPGVVILRERDRAGLNAALEQGAAWLRAQHPEHAVAALCADLPALVFADLSAALAQAAEHPRAFVLDAAGTGTTLLCAGGGEPLDPRFGPASGLAHGATGAVAVHGALASLRRDVDDDEDLTTALALGVGRWTAEELALD